MMRRLLLLVVFLTLISGSLSCGAGKSDVLGTYLCTQGSKDYDKGNILELKKDGTLYVYTPGESGVSGEWKLDGDEIYLIFEFFGLTWKGNIKGDTISLEEGSVWVKEKESTRTSDLTTPTTEITSEDIEWLATVIASEAGSVYDKGSWARCTDEERADVGWTVINRLKAGIYGESIKDIVTAPAQYAHNQQPNQEIEELAKKLLQGQIEDTTSGAINFFSPISMPKEGDSTAGFDTGGGLHAVTGIDKKVYFPSWTETMTYVGDLKNVRPAYFMFYRGTGTTQQASVPTPTQTQEPAIVKERGIEGVYTGCPEAEGKLEVSHSVTRVFNESSYYPAPEIKITIKNISNNVIDIGTGNKYNTFTLNVISKDKDGKTLKGPSRVYFRLLEPKEVRSEKVSLFSSDETAGYEIILEYKKPPQITGSYIESTEAEGKIAVNHYVKTGESSLTLMVEVTNISSEPIGRPSWEYERIQWYIEVKFKDSSNNVIGSEEEVIAEEGGALARVLEPGETHKMGIGYGCWVPEETKSYEITIVKKIVR